MERKRTTRLLLGAAFLGAALGGAARAEEALLSASDDTFILADTVGWSRHNWGVFQELAIGLNAANQPYRSLLRFDLSSLGAETSITSATLTLTVTRVHKLIPAHGNFDLHLFLLDNANKEWVQGAKLEHPATAGEPCWRYRQLDTGTWAGGPGIGNSTNSPGIAALLGTVQIDVTNTVAGTVYTFTIDTPEGLNALAEWAAGGDNAGLFMTTDEGSVTNAQNVVYFGSRENTAPANRPKLTVHTTSGNVEFGASDDTFIWNSGLTLHSLWNWGQNNMLYTGLNAADKPYRALLRFDLSPLRARYTTLDGAALTLTVRNTNQISVARGNFDLRLFLLSDANVSWKEGSKVTGDFAVTGEPCWDYAVLDTVDWIGGHGIGSSAASPGVSNLLASVTVDVATVTNGQKIVFPLDAPVARAAFEAWARGGANAGLLLVTDEASGGQNAIAFASAEYATAADRPVLAVTYTADETAFVATEDNFTYSMSTPIDYRVYNWGNWSSRRLGIGVNDSAGNAYRALLRFDLTSLARAHKRVKWATLTLTQDDNAKIKPANGASFDVRLLLLSDANSGWIEGTKNAAVAGTGESCWAWRQYNTVPWEGGPGIGNGTDSAGVAAQLAAATVNTGTINVGTNIVFHIETPEGLAALERWARGGVNAGFLLATDETSSGQNALLVGSREHTTAARRPTLRVVLEPKIPTGTLIRVQ
jgi:hypothetical protein